MEHSSDVIALLDATGTILYTSPPVTRLLGYGPAELVGRSAFELLHPDDLARAQNLFAGLLSGPPTGDGRRALPAQGRRRGGISRASG